MRKINRIRLHFTGQIIVMAVCSLMMIWGTAVYELHRSRNATLREAEIGAVKDAQITIHVEPENEAKGTGRGRVVYRAE